MTSFKLITS